MAHIQLINVSETKSMDGKIWRFSYGFPIIIRSLMETKHTFNVTDLHLHKMTFEDLFEFIDNCDDFIFGISAYSNSYVIVKEVVKKIRKKNPEAVIIVGGFLSGNDDVLMKCTEVDIVVTSAIGEKVLPEILDALDANSSVEHISGLTYKDRKNGQIMRTSKRKIISRDEYCKTPRPAYEYFDKELKEMTHNINSMSSVPVKGFSVITQRGCPFSCTFCGDSFGNHYLRKEWKDVFEEFEFLIDRYGVQGLYSVDTNFFLNRKDVDDYCRTYRERGHTFDMVIPLRPTFGDDEMFRKLAKHGIKVITFGIEHGNQKMLNRMKKKYNLNKMKKVYKAAVDAGICIYGNFIFGTPGENKDTIQDSKELMLFLEKLIYEQKIKFKQEGKICTSGYTWSILLPSPPSELYNTAIKKGLIEDEEQYLIALCAEKLTKTRQGKVFDIELSRVGGDVNMSEFVSKSDLIFNVEHSIMQVKLQSLLFDDKKEIPRSELVEILNEFSV